MQIHDSSTEKDGQLNIRKSLNLKPLDTIPDVEWWDAFFLPKD